MISRQLEAVQKKKYQEEQQRKVANAMACGVRRWWRQVERVVTLQKEATTEQKFNHLCEVANIVSMDTESNDESAEKNKQSQFPSKELHHGSDLPKESEITSMGKGLEESMRKTLSEHIEQCKEKTSLELVSQLSEMAQSLQVDDVMISTEVCVLQYPCEYIRQCCKVSSLS